MTISHRIPSALVALLAYVVVIVSVTGSSAQTQAPRRTFITNGINIYGNQKIRTYIIRREIPFQPGDAFDPATLEAAARRIRRLPGVDHSNVAVFVSPTDSTLAVNVSVTEKSAVEGKLRFDRGRENDIGAGLTMTQHNLRGRSEELWSSFLLGSGQQYEIGWENPWIAGGNPWNRFGVGLRGFFEDYEYVYDDLGAEFDGRGVQRIGGEANLFWTRGGTSRMYLAGGFESVEGDVEGMTLQGNRDNYVTLGGGAILDGRDGTRFPWSGACLRLDARQLGPGDAAYDIFRANADGSAFLPLFGRLVLAANSRFTYHDGNTIAPYMREHLGGINTLRGYDYGSYHGINSLLGSVELRIPANFSRQDPMEDLLLGVELHFFADTGAAWERGQDVDTDLFHSTYGIGLTVMNRNIAPIRFDWGWHDGSKVDFGFDVGLMF